MTSNEVVRTAIHGMTVKSMLNGVKEVTMGRRIVVKDSPGAGKSTFAAKLGTRLALLVIE